MPDVIVVVDRILLLSTSSAVDAVVVAAVAVAVVAADDELYFLVYDFALHTYDLVVLHAKPSTVHHRQSQERDALLCQRHHPGPYPRIVVVVGREDDAAVDAHIVADSDDDDEPKSVALSHCYCCCCCC